jgi:hypothetical protein
MTCKNCERLEGELEWYRKALLAANDINERLRAERGVARLSRGKGQHSPRTKGEAMGLRRHIFADINTERAEQDEKWGGPEHDGRHSDNDWVAYIAKHLGKAVVWPFDRHRFRKQMIRVAALAVAAIEVIDRSAEGENE